MHLFETNARSRAKEADEALARGQSWGALHGVPVTIKESFLIANTPSTLNSKRMKDFIAREDAVIVKRIKSAGGVMADVRAARITSLVLSGAFMLLALTVLCKLTTRQGFMQSGLPHR